MKPTFIGVDKEKKELVKLRLESGGYDFNTRGLHRFQKEHGFPETSFISDSIADMIIDIYK